MFPQRDKNVADPQDSEVKQVSLGQGFHSVLATNCKAYEAKSHQLSRTNALTTESKTSVLDKHGTALFIKRQLPLTPLASPTHREICHIHTSDKSEHVTPSFADAEQAVAEGWGQRHRLSGTDWLHLGYTMVYVPRSVEETAVLCKILQAGVDYMQTASWGLERSYETYPRLCMLVVSQTIDIDPKAKQLRPHPDHMRQFGCTAYVSDH